MAGNWPASGPCVHPSYFDHQYRIFIFIFGGGGNVNRNCIGQAVTMRVVVVSWKGMYVQSYLRA